MLIVTAGSVATLSIPLYDQNGQGISVESIQYRVTDQDGLEVLPLTSLIFEADSETAEIEMGASLHTLANGMTRSLRVVELFLVTPSGPASLLYRYLVKAGDPLMVTINSFQTFSQAVLRATEISNVDAWDAASDDRKQSALIDSYGAIAKLQFTEVDNIRDLTLNEFSSLDKRFVEALCAAQVIEANSRLGGTDVSDLRRDGLMSATVGEVSQMFRVSKPLSLPVSNRTLQALTGYLSWSRGVSR